MNNGVRRPMQELNLTDRFLFAETMDEPEAYEAAVGILLEKEIVLPGPSQTEKELRISPLLEPGSKDFNLLNDSCMILVAPFDLFGHGSYRYTFEGQCREIPGLPLQDGATRIFINTHGKNREAFSQEFLDFMEYINDTRDEVAARSGSARIKLIHSRVEKVRHSEKCGVKYMQRWEEIAYARQDGYEAGALREVLAAVCKKLAKGKGEEQIAEELEKSPEEIHWICEVARKHAPAYNQDTIYQELRA